LNLRNYVGKVVYELRVFRTYSTYTGDDSPQVGE
jgi:hypothetical protein